MYDLLIKPRRDTTKEIRRLTATLTHCPSVTASLEHFRHNSLYTLPLNKTLTASSNHNIYKSRLKSFHLYNLCSHSEKYGARYNLNVVADKSDEMIIIFKNEI